MKPKSEHRSGPFQLGPAGMIDSRHKKYTVYPGSRNPKRLRSEWRSKWGAELKGKERERKRAFRVESPGMIPVKTVV